MRTLSPPWRRVLVGSWIMILVLSVALVTLYVDNKRTRDCISGYMVADQQSSLARAQVADQERAAFLSTLTEIVNPKGSPVTRKEAIDAYIALVQRDDAVRKQNPIRSVPTRCD